MKGITKALIFGTVTLVLGGAIYATALTIAFNNRSQKEIVNRSDAQYVLTDDSVTGLDLDSVVDSIVVKSGDVSNVTIDYKDDKENPTFDIGVSNGILKFSQRSLENIFTFKWPWEKFNYGPGYAITVTVPSSSNLSYDIDSLSGSIKATDISSAKKLSGNTLSGSIEIKGCEFGGKVDLNSASGALTIENTKAHNGISLNNTSGKITAKNIEADESIKVNSTSGAVAFESVKAKSIDASTVSGAITLAKAEVSKGVMASTTSGSVSVSLVGNDAYNVSTTTVSGKVTTTVNLDSSSEKSVSVTTVSGNIKVEYAV